MCRESIVYLSKIVEDGPAHGGRPASRLSAPLLVRGVKESLVDASVLLPNMANNPRHDECHEEEEGGDAAAAGRRRGEYLPKLRKALETLTGFSLYEIHRIYLRHM